MNVLEIDISVLQQHGPALLMRALAQATVRALARKGAAITAGVRSFVGPRLFKRSAAPGFWFENGYESLPQTSKTIIQGSILTPAFAGLKLPKYLVYRVLIMKCKLNFNCVNNMQDERCAQIDGVFGVR